MTERRPDTGDEGRHRILRERAARLAAVSAADERHDVVTVLRVRLGTGLYAVDVSAVRETLTLRELTPLPGAPPFILGIISVRGRILSITDGRQLLGLDSSGAVYRDVAVLEGRDTRFGLAVDEVVDVVDLALREIHPPPAPLTGAGSRYLRGLTAAGMAVLDTDAVLTDEQLIVRQTPSGRG